MTGIGASQKEKELSRLLYRICGSGLFFFGIFVNFPSQSHENMSLVSDVLPVLHSDVIFSTLFALLKTLFLFCYNHYSSMLRTPDVNMYLQKQYISKTLKLNLKYIVQDNHIFIKMSTRGRKKVQQEISRKHPS